MRVRVTLSQSAATLSSVSASTVSAPSPQATLSGSPSRVVIPSAPGPPARESTPWSPDITSSPPPPSSVSLPAPPLTSSEAPPAVTLSAPVPASTVAETGSDSVAVSSRSPRSTRTRCTPPSGQNVWMIQLFRPRSPGVQFPGSMPPSTLSSRNSIRLPLVRTTSEFSDVASAERYDTTAPAGRTSEWARAGAGSRAPRTHSAVAIAAPFNA